ncbi:putative Ca2+/H+ antiporter (TMEM165/GDT1 family) [Catenulispora sp. GP43]|uniref:TMEM165/GDT1 family protein n=1 Tax=Catenulispora sp. GP43 TaxID=3156263 RepID=UPI003510F708
MSLAALLTTFGVVFLAELPDKTAIASLILGARYRPSWVFAGVAAGFLVHVCLAVAAGSLLALVPRRPLEAVVAVLFLAGAVVMLRSHGHGGSEEGQAIPGQQEDTAPDLGADAGFGKVAGTAFGVILVAEFGDLTQIVTANLAAKFADPLAVGIGAALGLWTVGALAIVGGRGLLRVLPLHLIVRLAALVMIVLAGVSLWQAVAG